MLDEIKGYGKVKMAMALAIATKQNLLIYGRGEVKNQLVECMQELQTKMNYREQSSVNRIYSLAGLLGNKLIEKRPFRIPHQSATIEGIAGGGARCRPGEISLAHNGILLLKDAAEFRSSVLQVLRVPLESKAITLSRVGRSTVYPANFQLVMTTNTCACGNYGMDDKVCLCSSKSVGMYWKKFSSPLINRIGIRICADDKDKTDYTVEELKAMIKKIEGKPVLFQSVVFENLKRFYDSRMIDNIKIILSAFAELEDKEVIDDELVNKSYCYYDNLPEECMSL